MKKRRRFLPLFPALLLTLTSCGSIARMNAMINQSTDALRANREAIQRSTEVIRENSELIKESNEIIEENQRQLAIN